MFGYDSNMQILLMILILTNNTNQLLVVISIICCICIIGTRWYIGIGLVHYSFFHKTKFGNVHSEMESFYVYKLFQFGK